MHCWLLTTIKVSISFLTPFKIGSKEANAKGKELLTNVESLRQKIGGKSIPDEKFAARKAANYVKGVSKMPFGFMEAAYWFNYLKIGNGNQQHATYWLDYLKV